MTNKNNDECKVVEQVSATTSSLHNTNDNDNAADTQDSWKSRLDKSLTSLEQQTREFNKKLQPQMSNINKLITTELHDIHTKESQLGEQFKNKLDEYKKVSLGEAATSFLLIHFQHAQITHTQQYIIGKGTT